MANNETETDSKARASAPLIGQKVITLRVTGGGRTYRLHKRRVVVGSVVSADVRLSGEGISPIHAVIELESRPGTSGAADSGDGSGDVIVYDLASDSGVQVNGQKIVTQRLKEGDRIQIGSHELILSVEELANLIPRESSREAAGSGGRRLFLDPGEDLGALLLEDGTDVQPIFDYAPAQARALEVIMAWRDTVLDVLHFVERHEVTIGATRDCDFPIPPLLGRGPYALAVRRGGQDFSLRLDPEMRGVMQRNGTLQTLDEIRETAGRPGEGQARAASDRGGFGFPLLEGDFAKISVGEIDFYLCYTAAPPRLLRGRVLERDPVFLRAMSLSLTLTAAVVLTLLNLEPPQPIDADQLPERIATIIYQPEKYPQLLPRPEPQPPVPEAKKPEPKPVDKTPQPPKVKPEPRPTVKLTIHPHQKEPKPAPPTMKVAPPVKVPPHSQVADQAHHAGQTDLRHQSEAKEGEGARAQGKEGTRGQQNAKPGPGPEHQEKAMRPSLQGGQGRGAGDSQVQNEGNVDILKDATGKIQDILGNSAAHLGSGGEKLKGFGGFTTQGNGGLALSGNGRGGGGDADSLGGLGHKGHGGGRVGTGLGASGSGSGIIGGQSRVAIRTGGPEEAVVMGSIDADAVEAALLAHKDEFRLCYEKEVNAENPGLAGRVGTSFVIGSSGRVTQAGIESTTLHNANTERCILAVIRRIDFPIPRGAGVVQVTYPFKFSPVGK